MGARQAADRGGERGPTNRRLPSAAPEKAPQWQTRRQGAHVGGGGGGKRGRREPCREPRSNPALVGIGTVLVKSGRACPSAPSHQPVPSAHPMEKGRTGGGGRKRWGPLEVPVQGTALVCTSGNGEAEALRIPRHGFRELVGWGHLPCPALQDPIRRKRGDSAISLGFAFSPPIITTGRPRIDQQPSKNAAPTVGGRPPDHPPPQPRPKRLKNPYA